MRDEYVCQTEILIEPSYLQDQIAALRIARVDRSVYKRVAIPFFVCLFLIVNAATAPLDQSLIVCFKPVHVDSHVASINYVFIFFLGFANAHNVEVRCLALICFDACLIKLEVFVVAAELVIDSEHLIVLFVVNLCSSHFIVADVLEPFNDTLEEFLVLEED